MFYKDANGQRMEVNLRMPGPDTMSLESYEKPEGSNKNLLYIALVIGLLVAVGSGYLVYKRMTKKEKFGYRY